MRPGMQTLVLTGTTTQGSRSHWSPWVGAGGVCPPLPPCDALPGPRTGSLAGSLMATMFPKGFFPFSSPSPIQAVGKDRTHSEIAAGEPRRTLSSCTPGPRRVRLFTAQFSATATLHGAGQQHAATPKTPRSPKLPTPAPPCAHTLQRVRVSTRPTPPRRLRDPLPSLGW